MAVSQNIALTLKTQSVESNYSIVRFKWDSTQSGDSWNGYTKTAYYYVSKNGGAEEKYSVTYSLPKDSTKTIVDAEIVVPHKTDGTGTVKVRTWMDTGISVGVLEDTKTLSLPTIPRQSKITVANGTLGSALTINVAKQADNLTHTITYKCGSRTGTICEKSSSAKITWTPPNELAEEAPSANAVPVTFTITTYSGDTAIGSSTAAISCDIPETNTFVPVLLPSVSDAMGYLNTYGAYIQGQSKLKVEITTYGAYGAWITSVKTEFDGATYTEKSFSTNPIVRSGTIPVKITVTDSRGRVSVSNAEITVLPYEFPKITALTATRCDANGNPDSSGAYLLAKFSATISSLNNKNTARYYVGYKKTTDADHIAVEQTSLAGVYNVNSSYIIPADPASSYTVIFTAVDAFGQARNVTTGSSVKKTLSFLKKNGEIVGMAVGKMAEHENVFDVGWPVKFSGGGDTVIEQGEKDGWGYRKWDSGVAECWKIYEFSTTIATAFGSLYCGNATARQAYPFVFAEKPVENVTLQAGTTQAFLYVETGEHGVNGTNSSARYNVFRPGAYSNSATFYLSFHVIGKWK